MASWLPCMCEVERTCVVCYPMFFIRNHVQAPVWAPGMEQLHGKPSKTICCMWQQPHDHYINLVSCQLSAGPASSVMPECPALKLVLQWTGSRKHVTYLGSFGGFSQKPLQLWSPWCGVGALIRERPIDMASSPLVRRHDENRFTGDKELLAESQCYTRAFGKAVARIVAEEWQWFDLSLLNGKDLDLSLLTIHNWWENDLWVCSYLLTDSLTAPRVFDNYGEFWMTEWIDLLKVTNWLMALCQIVMSFPSLEWFPELVSCPCLSCWGHHWWWSSSGCGKPNSQSLCLGRRS